MLSEAGATRPGRLRLRLILETPTRIADGAGGATVVWSEVATVPADVQPVKADERAIGEGEGDLALHRIIIRSRSDVAAGGRFRLGERIFRIRSVSDPQEDGRYLVCLCEEEGRP